MPGPLKVAVRFVVFRLCVPVSACSVEVVRVGLPNGNQPCSVPSAQSLWMLVNAPMPTVSDGSGGGASLEQATAATTKHNEATISGRLTRTIAVFPPGRLGAKTCRENEFNSRASFLPFNTVGGSG